MDAWARDRLAAARVGRLATVREDGAPHLVPVVFAVTGEVLWTAVDGKPKSTRALRRLANIEAHPRVSLLVDQYDDDWTRLWWVRVDGTASVLEAADDQATLGLAALIAKYEQYQSDPPPGPVIRVAIDHGTAWSAAGLLT